MKYYAIRVIAIVFLLAGMQHIASAQDVDVYQYGTNSNFVLPQIPAGMTYREFDLLSTRVRMQDIFFAMVVPGYIHFRIYEKEYGYWLLGIRAAGFAGMGYLALQNRSWYALMLNPAAKYSDPHYKRDIAIADISLVLIAGSFFYDWIHGRYMLQQKQHRIRFKFAPRVSLLSTPASTGRVFAYTAGIRINF